MTLYVDTSAWLKRYVDEPDSERAQAILDSDRQLVTGRHTIVEMRHSLARLLSPTEAVTARHQFTTDLASFALVELDPVTCELAATIAEQSGLRTLDSLHLGAAQRLGRGCVVATFDAQQAQVARSLGIAVAGA